MRHWTPEERKRQAEKIREWQPWKTPGVKSPTTRKASSRNAVKDGLHDAEMKHMRRMLAEARKKLQESGLLIKKPSRKPHGKLMRKPEG